MMLVIARNSWDDYPWEIQEFSRRHELHLVRVGLTLRNSTPQKTENYN